MSGEVQAPTNKRSILLCNQNWFAAELMARGHKVVTAGPANRGFDIQYQRPGTPIDKLLAELPRGFTPDALIYHDDSGPAWITGLETLEVPSIFYSVDAHHHSLWHKHFGAAFDKVYVAQRDYLREYQEISSNAEWLPLWIPITLKPLPQSERTIPVSFRGSMDQNLHPERVRFFAKLREKLEVDAGWGEYALIYTNSKIVINQAVKNDFNFRVFEALASGALLITPYVENGLTDLFTPGEDIVTYDNNNVDEAAEKIRYYLSNDAERERIAANGFRKVQELHTAEARAIQIEKCLSGLTRGERKAKHFGTSIAYLSSSLTCRMLDDLWGDFFLTLAVQELIRSVEAREPVVRDLEEMAIAVRNELNARQSLEFCCEFTRRLSTARPDNMVFATLHHEGLQKLIEKNTQATT